MRFLIYGKRGRKILIFVSSRAAGDDRDAPMEVRRDARPYQAVIRASLKVFPAVPPAPATLGHAIRIVIHLSAGYSEDSDYTSDLNYPVGGQGANSSASQFRTAANQLATPQRSLETSRENSYERDDHQVLIDDGEIVARHIRV